MARGPGKGKTNNPNGRPKGTPNKLTLEAREAINSIIEGQVENIKESLIIVRNEDDHYKYLILVEKFLGYVIPKKKDITSDDKPIQPAINIIEDRAKSETD